MLAIPGRSPRVTAPGYTAWVAMQCGRLGTATTCRGPSDLFVCIVRFMWTQVHIARHTGHVMWTATRGGRLGTATIAWQAA